VEFELVVDVVPVATVAGGRAAARVHVAAEVVAAALLGHRDADDRADLGTPPVSQQAPSVQRGLEITQSRMNSMTASEVQNV